MGVGRQPPTGQQIPVGEETEPRIEPHKISTQIFETLQ